MTELVGFMYIGASKLAGWGLVKQLSEICAGHGAIKYKALNQMTADFAEKGDLAGILNPLRDNLQVELLCHIHEAGHDSSRSLPVVCLLKK